MSTYLQVPSLNRTVLARELFGPSAARGIKDSVYNWKLRAARNVLCKRAGLTELPISPEGTIKTLLTETVSKGPVVVPLKEYAGSLPHLNKFVVVIGIDEKYVYYKDFTPYYSAQRLTIGSGSNSLTSAEADAAMVFLDMGSSQPRSSLAPLPEPSTATACRQVVDFFLARIRTDCENFWVNADGTPYRRVDKAQFKEKFF